MTRFYAPAKHGLRTQRRDFQQTSLAILLGPTVTSLLFGQASCASGGKRVQREVALQSATFFGADPWTSDLTSAALLGDDTTTGVKPSADAIASPIDVTGTQRSLWQGDGHPLHGPGPVDFGIGWGSETGAAWTSAAGPQTSTGMCTR
jgi:hypothetical protein